MVWKKYLVILLGITASGVMWWKVLTTPNIPSPALQGLIFTAVMAFLVWFALGFPKKKKPVSADELEEHLISSGFSLESTQNETIYKKDTAVIKVLSFDSKSDAIKGCIIFMLKLILMSQITAIMIIQSLCTLTIPLRLMQNQAEQ